MAAMSAAGGEARELIEDRLVGAGRAQDALAERLEAEERHEEAIVVVDGGVEIVHRAVASVLDATDDLLLLSLEHPAAAKEVDGAVLRRGHEPGARVVRDACLRPLLERGDERVLRQVLGEADVPHDPDEPRDHLGGLDPPDCVDLAACVGHYPVAPPGGASDGPKI